MQPVPPSVPPSVPLSVPLSSSEELAAAKAKADQRLAHVTTKVDDLLIAQARRLLAEHSDPVEAWAILTARIARGLRCASRPQILAAEMLAATGIRLAQQQDTPPAHNNPTRERP